MLNPLPAPQRDRALSLLTRHGMLRQAEFLKQGITAATVSRLVSDGSIVRLSRGLYQLPDGPSDTHHALAQAAKRVPKGVVCLLSALAFHDLTDQQPPKVWIAVGRKSWTPVVEYPPLRITRFSERALRVGVENHEIEGVQVPIYGVAKTLADVFRYRRQVGISVCVESLRAALKQRKATPAEISRVAAEAGSWKAMQPYLETLLING